jgi:O-antigen/teichoic acid export membrane protein
MKKNDINHLHFNISHLKHNLKERSVKGGLITTASQFFKLAIQVGSNIFLARLLTPSDYGLIAMVAVVASFIVMFKDLGLSQATIQNESINHTQISTLFWINAAFGLLIMLITWLMAPTIAAFYNQPLLIDVTIVFAFGLFIGGLTVQHQALLKRQMRFKELAIVEISSMLIGVIAGIAAALIGLGYWALVILQITQAVITLIGVWYFVKWRPGLPDFNCGIGSMLSFGSYMTAYGFINYFARNLDTILIGWRWGATPVGFYSRAYSLLLLPIGQLTAPFSAVAVPALSRLQNDPVEFKNYYLKLIKIIAYVSMPMIISMAILAHEIVYIVLGPQWNSAADLFQVLAIAAFWQPIASTAGWVYVSLGNIKRMMYWGLIGTTVMAVAIIIGLPSGASGVALAYSISMWILVLPIFSFAFYKTPINIISLIKTLKFPIVVAIVSGIGLYFSYWVLLDLSIDITFLGTFNLIQQKLFVLFGTLFCGFLPLILLISIWQSLKKDIIGIFLSISTILKSKLD